MKRRKVESSQLVSLNRNLRQTILGFLREHELGKFRTVHPSLRHDTAMWSEIVLCEWFPLQMQLCVASHIRSVVVALDSEQMSLAAVAVVAAACKVTELDLSTSRLCDHVLLQVAACEMLVKLDLNSAYDVSHFGFAHLSALPCLKWLDLGDAGITNDSLTHVCKLARLEHLDLLHNTLLTDFSPLARLHNLKSLNLKNCMDIQDADMFYLRELPLVELFLTDCDTLTDAGIVHVAALDTLETLSIANCSLVSDAAFSRVGSNLQVLDLNNCTLLTDAGLAHLLAARKMTNLNLSGCLGITDVGLCHLGQLRNLKELSLQHCWKITDEGVAHLEQLDHLETVNLYWCDKVTEKGVLPLTKKFKRLLLWCHAVK